MRIIGNLLWWLFGGLEAAFGYFTGSLAMAITIIGLPVAWQTFKIGLLCLWPFGSEVRSTDSPTGCIRHLAALWWIMGLDDAHILWLFTIHHHHRHSICQATFQDGWAFLGSFW